MKITNETFEAAKKLNHFTTDYNSTDALALEASSIQAMLRTGHNLHVNIISLDEGKWSFRNQTIGSIAAGMVSKTYMDYDQCLDAALLQALNKINSKK